MLELPTPATAFKNGHHFRLASWSSNFPTPRPDFPQTKFAAPSTLPCPAQAVRASSTRATGVDICTASAHTSSAGGP